MGFCFELCFRLTRSIAPSYARHELASTSFLDLSQYVPCYFKSSTKVHCMPSQYMIELSMSTCFNTMQNDIHIGDVLACPFANFPKEVGTPCYILGAIDCSVADCSSKAALKWPSRIACRQSARFGPSGSVSILRACRKKVISATCLHGRLS